MERGATEGLEPAPYFIRDELSDTLESLLPDDINPPFPTSAFRDATASDLGPFPLVLFAHGSSSYRNQSTFLTTHLASWGFVVASVDYLERGLGRFLGPDPDPIIDDVDLTRMVVALMTAETDLEGSVLEGVVSTDQIGENGGGVIQIALDAGLPIPDSQVLAPSSPGLAKRRGRSAQQNQHHQCRASDATPPKPLVPRDPTCA